MSDLKNPLGKSKAMVSPLGLGMVGMAGYNHRVTYREVEEAIDAAYKGGIKYFDAARSMAMARPNTTWATPSVSSASASTSP